MGTTANFLKLRASESSAVKPGQWHAGFQKVKKYAESNKIPLIAVWSNGDVCGHCVMFETVLMKKIFKDWMAKSGCAFWFGCSSDTAKDNKVNGAGYTFAWGDKSAKLYPFIRVYWKAGKVDASASGGTWSGDSSKNANATKLVKKIQTLLKNFKPQIEPTPAPEPTPEPTPEPVVCKVRLNEALTVAQINKVLDALDKNEGYCPCQVGKTADTKCHCKDFKENKKIGEPCICKIFVKKGY